MSTPPVVRTFNIVQRQGSNDTRLHGEIRVMLEKVFEICGITGNFHVSLSAFSDDTLPKRAIKFRTYDPRAIRSRCRGDKSQTWNIDIVGPDLPSIFEKLGKNSLNGQRLFEFNRDFNIKSAPVEILPVATPPPKINTPPEKNTAQEEPKERFSITKNPEHLVLALSYIAEACDQSGHITFKEVCRVVNENFAVDGEEISEAKIRPGVTGLLVTKGYLTIVSNLPTVYTLSESGIALLEQNSMIKAEVKAKYKVKVTFRGLGINTAVPVPSSQAGSLETKLAELQAQINNHGELQAQGAALVERRNAILARKKVLEQDLADIPEQLRRVETEITETAQQIDNLAAARQRYDQIMRLLAQ